jgi:hypothetical protein
VRVCDTQKHSSTHPISHSLPLEYLPKPFCYAIRRPEHYPEGTITIEALKTNNSESAQPVTTQVFENVHSQPEVHFFINAATKVTLKGRQYVHAWLNQQFADTSGVTHRLSARSRQFSSFVILLGKLNSPTEFAPKHAMIVQNKDDFLIPLSLSHLPTAKEFRDAVESLSPEQQRFCKAFRGMQLEGSLFCMCVVQIKPQLEKLLNLPPRALVKERRLVEQLMKLFVDYQISSDLVSYDGAEDEKVGFKVQFVKDMTNKILDEIKEEADKQLAERKAQVEFKMQQEELAMAFSLQSVQRYVCVYLHVALVCMSC